ncbi:MAG: right-handed parallel beta-helix repeat-containing protein [Planctomycetota bacterium]|nr:right-handed parallel beta-helix repeat-containing protein [Planctomycetota bacterium]
MSNETFPRSAHADTPLADTNPVPGTSLGPLLEIAMTTHTTHHRHSVIHRLASAGMFSLAGLLFAGTTNASDLNVPSGLYPTIQIALANAVDGDVIILAPNTYFESLDLGTLDITLRGSGGPDVTTIDAFGLGSVIQINGGQTTATLIEGLTITGGLAARGGGLNITNASATIRNCRIVGNDCTVAGGDGGGLFIENGTLVVEDTVFEDNHVADVGGAVYCRTSTTTSFTRCHFEGNTAFRGGALAANGTNTTVTDSTFLLNGTNAITEDGGAIWAFNAFVLAYRCHFEANVVYDDGSAVMAENSSIVDIENSVFLNNVSDSNATIYSLQSGTSVDVYHSTLVGNIAAGSSALRTFDGGVMTFHNGIIWGNTGGSVISGSVSASYSVIQAGYVGSGNLSVDPLLDLNLRPLPGSPAIDAANTYVLLGDDPLDFDSNPRAMDDPDVTDTGVPVYGLTADMGAFERQAVAAPTCPADINGESQVDVEDLLILLAAWGACP